MKSEFVTKTLFDIASIEKGSIISGPFGSNISSKYFQKSGVPVIRGNNLSKNSNRKFIDEGFVFVSEEKADELNAYAIKDDLIFTAAGTIGQVGIIDEKAKFEKYVISNKQLRVRLDLNKVNPLYAYYWYSSPWIFKEIVNKNTGSTVPLINLGIIKSIEINIPKERNIQDKIVAVLFSLDKKIELNQRINVELEAMAKTLYDYWFVQFDFPDKNGKPYKSSGGMMVWNEDLKREIPLGWEVKSLGDICNIYQPQTISGKEMTSNGKYLVFGANGVVGRYDQFSHSESEIVITCRGASCGNIIRTRPNSWITGNAMVIHPLDKNIGSEFICQLLAWLNIHKVITGSAQPQITRTNIAPLKIFVPPSDALKKFNEFSKSNIEKRLSILNENDELNELRDWLLPMLMNGQVTVG